MSWYQIAATGAIFGAAAGVGWAIGKAVVACVVWAYARARRGRGSGRIG